MGHCMIRALVWPGAPEQTAVVELVEMCFIHETTLLLPQSLLNAHQHMSLLAVVLFL